MTPIDCATRRENTECRPSPARRICCPRCGAAAICSDTASHPALVKLCCEAGIDVLCEKTRRDGCGARVGEMKSEIEASGIRYYQSFPQRHIPSNIKIKEILDSGVLGRITHVRKRHGHGFGFSGLEKQMPWIVDPAKSGGGALLDEGIHEADLLGWFFGKPVSVDAQLSHTGAYAVETSGTALFRFPGELLCVLECAWNWRAGGPTTEIYGEKGSILQSLTDCASNSGGGVLPHLSVFNGEDGQWRPVDISWDFSAIHDAVPKDFIDVLCGNGIPRTGIDEGLDAAEMIDGAYRSFREGRSVGFPLVPR